MAEKIIGRHSEKALLENLIRQYFRNQFSFDMTGVLEGNKNEQMTAFHMAQRDILRK